MNVTELLTNLTEQGVQFWADNDKLKIQSPKGILTPQLQADLATYKPEILSFLQQGSNFECNTSSGLSLQTIGRLIGGYRLRSPGLKPPVIDPKVMAKQLKVTFRPLPKGVKPALLPFREQLKLKLQHYGVRIVPWEEATRFTTAIALPLINRRMKTRVVKADINAVIDVERPNTALDRLKSLSAETLYHIYTRLGKNRQLSVAKITQLIGWADNLIVQRLEDPTATQVILIAKLDEKFVNAKSYHQKITIGVKTLVKNFSEIALGVSEQKISVLNMNLSDSLFPKEQFEKFVFKSLIPKIYVPIAPLPISCFQVERYDPNQSSYAAKLVELSQELAATELFPAGFKLSEIIKRKSHRDIVDSIVNGRTGVSYGFVAYIEPPQYVGKPEIDESEWETLFPAKGFSYREVRKNEIGRRYIKTPIAQTYRQIPDLWLVSSRSGANKTDLQLNDILRIGLTDTLQLQFPADIDPTVNDIKPSYDTYVMVAIALAAALYTPELTIEGAPMIHFHGYPSQAWFEETEYCAGVDNPSVPCGTYESGVFNFLSIHRLASQSDNITLASLIEPDHGTNIIARNMEYLLTRLEAGIKQGQIELGGKHFASLTRG